MITILNNIDIINWFFIGIIKQYLKCKILWSIFQFNFKEISRFCKNILRQFFFNIWNSFPIARNSWEKLIYNYAWSNQLAWPWTYYRGQWLEVMRNLKNIKLIFIVLLLLPKFQERNTNNLYNSNLSYHLNEIKKNK